MIGIIGALEEEVILLKYDIEVKDILTIAKCVYVVGKLNGQDVVITKCGMGKVNAASCAVVMIQRFHPNLIINTGVGGSLDKTLKVFDILISEDIVQHDYNLVSLGYQLGQVDNFPTPFFKCDKKIVNTVYEITKKHHLNSYKCRFATGDKFIDEEKDKKFITDFFNARVVDMESGAIAQTCALHEIQFISIRTISDTTTGAEEAIEFKKFLKICSTHSVMVIEELINYLGNNKN